MNNKPIRISLRIEKDARISSIIKQIGLIPEANIDLSSKNTDLCMYASSKGHIKGIFNPDYKLVQYSYQSDEIEAIEILTKSGR